MKLTQPKPTTKHGTPSVVARALAEPRVLLRLSVLGNVALIFVIILQPFFILARLSVPQRAIILDGAGSFTASPLVNLPSATPLHVECAADATDALLERNPENFDRPDEVQRWFTKSARAKANTLLEAETPEFKGKHFYQKVVLTKAIETTATGRETFSAHVVGQLIRTGKLNDRLHVETVDFDLTLAFVLNPDMATNKRYPYATWDFDIRYRQ